MTRINNSKDAVRVLKELFKQNEQEELWMLSLNSNNELKASHFVGLGSDDRVIISNKVICKHAVLDMAFSVIIAHNHPSGNPMPGSADCRCTESLKEALNLFEIKLMDHIVLGGKTYYSFSEEGVSNISEKH